jgi:hypothetical protein
MRPIVQGLDVARQLAPQSSPLSFSARLSCEQNSQPHGAFWRVSKQAERRLPTPIARALIASDGAIRRI